MPVYSAHCTVHIRICVCECTFIRLVQAKLIDTVYMWLQLSSDMLHVVFLFNLSATLRVLIFLPPSEYIGKVQDQLMVNISAFVTVKETESVFVDKETFRFKAPNIALSLN